MKKVRVAMIGCGKVGMTAAYTMFLKDTVNEIVLYSRNKDKLLGEQLDFQHSLSFLGKTDISIADKVEELKDVDIFIFTAGAAQEPGESRLELTKKNAEIVESLVPELFRYSPDAVMLMVTNPVDILTYKAWKRSGVPLGRVFGSGTVLDTSRFRFYLSQCVKINPRNIHAYVLGEHGDNSFPAMSNASIGGLPPSSFPYCSVDAVKDSYKQAREAAYTIIESKGATYYAIGVVINELVYAIANDTKQIYPVSVPLEGKYGFNDVAVSVPCVIGKHGVEMVLEIPLADDEKEKLANTVKTLKGYM